ncbi:MAG TPA: hypothetical protein VGF69_15685 [Thermoanaerobaculia bacterium]|jgi:hypothetical protein
MSKAVCVACRHTIDGAAKVCPYCGANPQTGERIDTQAMLQEIFRPRDMSTGESVLEYARQRQGIVIAVTLGVVFLVLAGLHQFISIRNDREVTNAAAVPLTEITDLSNQTDESKPVPMPELPFQYDGRPTVMRTYIMEQGAATPPEIIAEQQAEAEAKAKEAAEKAAAQAAKNPPPAGAQNPAVPNPAAAGQPVRPGVAPVAQPQARPFGALPQQPPPQQRPPR